MRCVDVGVVERERGCWMKGPPEGGGGGGGWPKNIIDGWGGGGGGGEKRERARGNVAVPYLNEGGGEKRENILSKSKNTKMDEQRRV